MAGFEVWLNGRFWVSTEDAGNDGLNHILEPAARRYCRYQSMGRSPPPPQPAPEFEDEGLVPIVGSHEHVEVIAGQLSGLHQSLTMGPD